MTASERIRLIKEISRQLGSEEWNIIDLTFRQFGFPTIETFNGSKFDYVLTQVQSAQDTSILELANHLKIDLEPHKPEIFTSFWRDGYLKLFISHLASDKYNAQGLKDKLDKYAISGFVAHSDIEPTKEWQNEIELALRTADALVALMIPNFHDSKWTDQEIGLAFGRDLLIIPVRMGQDPYGFIGKFQAITFTDLDILAHDIFDSILKNKKTRIKMSSAIIHKFENSDSFATAKSNMDLVEKIDLWDRNLIDRLTSSIENNSQIAGSFRVPAKISNIVYKFDKQK